MFSCSFSFGCSFYKVQNWFTFALLALLPAIFLVIGNGAIIIAFRKWTKQSRICQANNPAANSRTTAKRYQVSNKYKYDWKT